MEKQPQIMVVDDEEMILQLVNETLESEGFRVTQVNDGSLALSLMEEKNPDLVILDIMMPGLNGFELLEIIREHSNIPVIMLTGKCEVTTLRDALALGADDYVRKPFHPRELVARVRAKLRRTAGNN